MHLSSLSFSESGQPVAFSHLLTQFIAVQNCFYSILLLLTCWGNLISSIVFKKLNWKQSLFSLVFPCLTVAPAFTNSLTSSASQPLGFSYHFTRFFLSQSVVLWICCDVRVGLGLGLGQISGHFSWLNSLRYCFVTIIDMSSSWPNVCQSRQPDMWHSCFTPKVILNQAVSFSSPFITNNKILSIFASLSGFLHDPVRYQHTVRETCSRTNT